MSVGFLPAARRLLFERELLPVDAYVESPRRVEVREQVNAGSRRRATSLSAGRSAGLTLYLSTEHSRDSRSQVPVSTASVTALLHALGCSVGIQVTPARRTDPDQPLLVSTGTRRTWNVARVVPLSPWPRARLQTLSAGRQSLHAVGPFEERGRAVMRM